MILTLYKLFVMWLLCILFNIVIYLITIDLEWLKVLPPILPIILMVALFTLLERKVWASIQLRRGPNVVGFFGLLQPIADAIKLILKETIIPGLSNLFLFVIAPVLTFTLSLLGWGIIPIYYGGVLSDINLGLLFLFSISSLGVYGIIISGWASNSKYAFLGSLRSAAQFISYEVFIGIVVMTILVCVNSLNITLIIEFQHKVWFIIPLFPSFIMFFISALAETNRVPFDLPEAESELVSGYNVEYSATTFVLFFLAEYANIILMSVLIVIFFFGGWLPILNFKIFYFIPSWIWFILKIFIFMLLFTIIKGILPRYRYDQLMTLGWKVLLPISFIYLILICIIVFIFC